MSHDPLDQELAALGAPQDGLPIAHAGDILARAAAITPVVVGLSGWKLGVALAAAGLLGGVGGAATWRSLAGTAIHDTVVVTEVVETFVEVPVEVPVEVQVPGPTVFRTVASICAHPEEPEAALAVVAEELQMRPEDFDTDWLDDLPSPESKGPQRVQAPSVAELAEPDLGRAFDQELRLRVGSRLARDRERPLGTEAAVEWVGSAQRRRVGTPWVSAGAELASGAGAAFEAGIPLGAGLSWSGDRVGLEAGWTVTGSAARTVTPELSSGPGAGPRAEQVDWSPLWSTGPTVALRLGDEGRIRVGASGELTRTSQGEPLLRGGLSLGMQTDIFGGT